MNRREFLAASTISVAGLSGCLGRTVLGSDSSPNPKSEEGFDTVERYGAHVPLAPISVVHEWYEKGSAKFADARGKTQYDTSHIEGAVLSPAPDRFEKDDPVSRWGKKDRIVCYCGCPHHLSSMRAGKLMNNGYENVYVIDEGFWVWHDKGYPIEGKNTSYSPQSYEIDGVADSVSAGKTAWARHPKTGQREATGIRGDGSYSLDLKFYDVTPQSMITVQTPDYTVKGTIGDLSSGTVTGT